MVLLSFMIKSLSCAAGALVCGLAVAPFAKADGFYINLMVARPRLVSLQKLVLARQLQKILASTARFPLLSMKTLTLAMGSKSVANTVSELESEVTECRA